MSLGNIRANNAGTVTAAALALAILLAGCTPAPGAGSQPQVGRYQFIGKQKYDDGTVEYACLDTATGEIGYATIYADKDRQALNNFNCAN